MTAVPQGAPVVVTSSGGYPVVNTALGRPVTASTSNNTGLAVTVVSSYGHPVKIYNPDGTEWAP